VADKGRTGVSGAHRGVRDAVAPESGSLRGYLLQFGDVLCGHAREHASTMRAVRVGATRNPAPNNVMQHQLVDRRETLIEPILKRAVDRGEIDTTALTEDHCV